MAKKKNKSERGFAMITIVMVVALIAVGTYALNDVITSEYAMLKEHRNVLVARNIAEGGLTEMVSDQNFKRMLTLPIDPITGKIDLVTCDSTGFSCSRETPGGIALPISDTQSPFMSPNESYSGDITFLRRSSRKETSHGAIETLVYEVSSVGRKIDTHSEVGAEVFVLTTKNAGSASKTRHGR